MAILKDLQKKQFNKQLNIYQWEEIINNYYSLYKREQMNYQHRMIDKLNKIWEDGYLNYFKKLTN